MTDDPTHDRREYDASVRIAFCPVCRSELYPDISKQGGVRWWCWHCENHLCWREEEIYPRRKSTSYR
jgi:DNA-directed RNA polymerase subunit M/transcription elongation factor TFIIS